MVHSVVFKVALDSHTLFSMGVICKKPQINDIMLRYEVQI